MVSPASISKDDLQREPTAAARGHSTLFTRKTNTSVNVAFPFLLRYSPLIQVDTVKLQSFLPFVKQKNKNKKP